MPAHVHARARTAAMRATARVRINARASRARATGTRASREVQRRDFMIVMTSRLTLGAMTLDACAARAARAYGTGGWRDCDPVCDSLKDGRARQLALMREMSGETAEAPPRAKKILTKAEREAARRDGKT